MPTPKQKRSAAPDPEPEEVETAQEEEAAEDTASEEFEEEDVEEEESDEDADESDDEKQEEESDEEEEDFLADDEEDDDDLAESTSPRQRDPGAFSANRKPVEIDFTGETGETPTVDPGDYSARLSDVEVGESSTEKPMVTWTFQLTAGKYKNLSIRYWTLLTPDQRWKAAQVLKALGADVANKKFTLVPEKLIKKPVVLRIIADKKNEDFPYRIGKVLPPTPKAVADAKRATDLV